MGGGQQGAVIPTIDLRRCTGCGRCVEQCPTGAVERAAGKARIVRPEACSFCERCEAACPAGAIGRPFTVRFADDSEKGGRP
jgi:ferredoxin